MRFDYSGATPLYRQVAEQLSDAIASGAYAEGDQIPSTTEISVTYQLNPATVLKGMNLLVEQGLILMEKKQIYIPDPSKMAHFYKNGSSLP